MEKYLSSTGSPILKGVILIESSKLICFTLKISSTKFAEAASDEKLGIWISVSVTTESESGNAQETGTDKTPVINIRVPFSSEFKF